MGSRVLGLGPARQLRLDHGPMAFGPKGGELVGTCSRAEPGVYPIGTHTLF